MAEGLRVPPPRLALSYEEAAAALGLGRTTFLEEVLPHVKVLRVRSRRLIPVAELERYVAEHAERPLAEQVSA